MSYWLAFDCETGGLDPKVNTLLTAHFLVMDGDRLVEERGYNIFPREGYTTNPKALEVNNIDFQKHLWNSDYVDNVRADLMDFLSIYGSRNKLIPLGWNIHFDLGFIYEHLVAKPEWEQFVSYRLMDVQVLARFFLNAGSLEDTARELNIPHTAHTARSDALVTYHIYRQFERRYKNA